MASGVFFQGFGKYVAKTKETNGEVAQRLNISEQEIIAKSGVECRYLAKEESASFMGAEALREAMASAKIPASELSGIIVATFSGDYLYPNMASKLCGELRINGAFAFDVQANCAGFQMALGIARDRLLSDSQSKFIAVVGIARQSPFLDPNDVNTAYFFSDAASAVILGREAKPGGLGPSLYKTNPKSFETVRLRAGGSSFPYSPQLWSTDRHAFFYEHAGLGVWKEVMVEMPQLIRKTLDAAGWKAEDVDLILMHQANLRLIEYLMSRLKLPMTKTVTNVQTIGNTADASLGTVLYDAAEQKRLTSGAKIVLASVGAGFVYSATPYIA